MFCLWERIHDSTCASASYFSGCLKKDSIYYGDNYFTNDTYAYKLNCATPCQFDMETYKVKEHHISYDPPFWVSPHFQWD